MTPVGDLPRAEQGSYALVVAPELGSLLAMPLISAAENRIDSTVDAAVDPSGRVEVQYRREYYGQSGTGLRDGKALRPGRSEKTF